MGTIEKGAGGHLPPIHFGALAQALLSRADTLVPLWLPGGRARGHEYKCGSLGGGAGESCSVNLTTGKWADFAGDDSNRGLDLISLYAAIHGLTMAKAAIELARDLGLEDVAQVRRDAGHAGRAPPQIPEPSSPTTSPSPSSARKPEPAREGWQTMMPVPPNAPAPTFRHPFRSASDIEHKAPYRVDGQLLGYVVRFRTSDGGKETLPYTWCKSERDGTMKWHWRQFDEPRPLFYPGGEHPGGKHPDGRTVVLVEGEIKAEVLQATLESAAPGIYCVASWPGGSKAWSKALWDWLAGNTVLLWPDCDAKRVALTKTERDACADELARAMLLQSKPLLPEAKQPGMMAMRGIGAMLRERHGCTVSLLPIPKPGEVDDGWDARDAIEQDGWDGDRLLAFFGRAQPLPDDAGAGESASRAATAQGSEGGGGGREGGRNGGRARSDDEASDDDHDGDAFKAHLDFIVRQSNLNGPWAVQVNRKLVIAALRKAPALAGCIGFDELRAGVSVRQAWPWRAGTGAPKDTDDLRLGDFLSTSYGLKSAPRNALSEAIDTVADDARFHPVRDWLQGLRWDEKSRIDKWLIHVLGFEVETLPRKLRRYLELVGRFVLLGLVARVMKPGCKFDYSLVLEGKGGIGKSTFIKALVGEEFFSDTHFDIGTGKDGFEQFEGLWAYELSELTALRKADSEQIKQFFSSQVDRYRGAYGRYVQDHPRQVVIFCSTNKKQYLFDLSGNRRFWPVWLPGRVNLEWLARYREQLFAEALALFSQGERYFPTPEEEEDYFVPQQEKRLVETSVQSRLYELLTREGARAGEGRLTLELTASTTFVTIHQLVEALGTDAGKSGPMLESQIRGWLERYGWENRREKTGLRRRGYARPEAWPPPIEEDDDAPVPAPVVTPSEPSMPEPGARLAQGQGGSDDAPF